MQTNLSLPGAGELDGRRVRRRDDPPAAVTQVARGADDLDPVEIRVVLELAEDLLTVEEDAELPEELPEADPEENFEEQP